MISNEFLVKVTSIMMDNGYYGTIEVDNIEISFRVGGKKIMACSICGHNYFEVEDDTSRIVLITKYIKFEKSCTSNYINMLRIGKGINHMLIVL